MTSVKKRSPDINKRHDQTIRNNNSIHADGPLEEDEGVYESHDSESKKKRNSVSEILQGHAKNIFSPKTTLPFVHQSSLLGLSCFSYLIPIPWLSADIFKAAMVLQSILSFLGDYVYAGRTSYTHCMDRILASFLTTFFIGRAFNHLTFITSVVLSILPLICLYLGKKAVINKDMESYAIWHSLWHLVGALCLTYLASVGGE